jgi:hypothetical protein
MLFPREGTENYFIFIKTNPFKIRSLIPTPFPDSLVSAGIKCHLWCKKKIVISKKKTWH